MPATRPARTKAQQREETTRALIGTARMLFASKGYARVSLAEIVSATGVTKGALYHHFTSKDDLFRAVLEQVHADVADRVESASADADPWHQLVAGCAAFLSASTDPRIQRIMLIDAPAVLGWGTWRELDATASMRHLVDVLTRLIDAGILLDQPVLPLAHLLSGAMNEAALWLAGSANPHENLDATVTALTRMLEAQRVTPHR